MAGSATDPPDVQTADRIRTQQTVEQTTTAESVESTESETDVEPTKYPVQKTPMSQRIFAPRPSEQARARWQSGLAPTPRSPMVKRDASLSEFDE